MQPMRRVLVLHSDGGSTGAVAALRRAAAALHARGYEVAVRDIGGGLRAVRRVWAAMGEIGPDVVHAVDPRAMRTAVLVLTATRRRKPRVVASGCERADGRVSRFALRWVDQSVTLPGVGFSDDVTSRDREGAVAHRESHATAPSRSRLIKSEYILAAGGFDAAGEAKAAAWAFDVLKYAAPGLHLVLLGDGPRRPEIAAFSAALSPEDFRAHFPGYQPDVAGYLAHATAAWVTHRTGGTAFALEALAAGVPVLAFRTPDLGAIITDGVNGRLVPPGDPVALAAATRDLLADDALRRRLVGAGRATAAAYPAATFVDALAAVYDEAARPAR